MVRISPFSQEKKNPDLQETNGEDGRQAQLHRHGHMQFVDEMQWQQHDHQVCYKVEGPDGGKRHIPARAVSPWDVRVPVCCEWTAEEKHLEHASKPVGTGAAHAHHRGNAKWSYLEDPEIEEQISYFGQYDGHVVDDLVRDQHLCRIRRVLSTRERGKWAVLP